MLEFVRFAADCVTVLSDPDDRNMDNAPVIASGAVSSVMTIIKLTLAARDSRLWANGCASNPIAVSPTCLQRRMALQRWFQQGPLQVFAETETHQIGDNTSYNPHIPATASMTSLAK